MKELMHCTHTGFCFVFFRNCVLQCYVLHRNVCLLNSPKHKTHRHTHKTRFFFLYHTEIHKHTHSLTYSFTNSRRCHSFAYQHTSQREALFCQPVSSPTLLYCKSGVSERSSKDSMLAEYRHHGKNTVE